MSLASSVIRCRRSSNREAAPEKVLIHDGVRPFVDADLISRTIAAVGEREAALPAVPVSDTLKRGGKDGTVAKTVTRDGLFAAQTPQGRVRACPRLRFADERVHKRCAR